MGHYFIGCTCTCFFKDDCMSGVLMIYALVGLQNDKIITNSWKMRNIYICFCFYLRYQKPISIFGTRFDPFRCLYHFFQNLRISWFFLALFLIIMLSTQILNLFWKAYSYVCIHFADILSYCPVRKIFLHNDSSKSLSNSLPEGKLNLPEMKSKSPTWSSAHSTMSHVSHKSFQHLITLVNN